MALRSWLMIVSMFLFQLPNKLNSQSDFTQFELNFFDTRDETLIYQGDAHVPPWTARGEPANQTLIRMTRVEYHPGFIPKPGNLCAARVVYSAPIRLWDRAGRRHANFQTVIQGYIGNSFSSYIGSGMVFFVAPVNATNTIPPHNSIGGNLGLYNSTTGLSPIPLFAVELDITEDRWDPPYRHVGINVNSRESVATARLDSLGLGDVEARITYDARHRLISVFANASGNPSIATVEHTFDLRTLLPEWVQIGISSSTGLGPTAVHDISRWTFTSFMVSDDSVNMLSDT